MHRGNKGINNSPAKPEVAAKTRSDNAGTVGTVGNIGYGKDHRTQYSKLNLGNYDQQTFLIKS